MCGICNRGMIQGGILWLYDSKLEQAMRDITYGDQQILLMVI